MMIRKMQLDDLTQVAALEQSLFGDPWSEKAFRDTLEQEEADFIVPFLALQLSWRYSQPFYCRYPLANLFYLFIK